MKLVKCTQIMQTQQGTPVQVVVHWSRAGADIEWDKWIMVMFNPLIKYLLNKWINPFPLVSLIRCE